MKVEDIYGPLRAVAMAASKDESRTHMNAVRVEIEKVGVSGERGTIRFVATDGHMMAMSTESVELPGAPGTYLIPLETVNAALAAMKSLRGTARKVTPITIGADVIIVGAVSLAYRQVDATFPPYEQIIPSGEVTGVPHIGFTGALVARVANMFDAVGRELFGMQFRGEVDPVDCTHPHSSLRVILMPARVYEPKAKHLKAVSK